MVNDYEVSFSFIDSNEDPIQIIAEELNYMHMWAIENGLDEQEKQLEKALRLLLDNFLFYQLQ